MSSYLFSPSCLDPLKGVLDFISDVKPFRTKVIQAGVSIAFNDSFAVSIAENWLDTASNAWIRGAQFDIDQTFNLHTGNCDAPIDSCLLFDGFESDGYGDPQVDTTVQAGAIVLTSEHPVELTFFTRSYQHAVDFAAQQQLPPTTSRFIFKLFSDVARTNLIAQSPEVVVSTLGDIPATAPVLYTYGEYALITSTTALSTRPDATSTGKVTFAISGPDTSALHYVIVDTSQPQPTAFGTPTNQGFESTRNYSLFTDYTKTIPVEGNPSFAYYTLDGDPVFYATGDCGTPYDWNCSTDIEFEFETLLFDDDALEDFPALCFQPSATPVCPTEFDVVSFDGGFLESADSLCTVEPSWTVPSTTELCTGGFEEIPLNETSMDYVNLECIDTCAGQFAGPCTTDAAICYDRSPTTVVPTFSESLDIRDDENELVLRFVGSVLLDPIYAYTPSNTPIISPMQLSLTALDPIAQYSIVCYNSDLGTCWLANYADTDVQQLGIAINSAASVGDVLAIATLSGSVTNPMWALPVYDTIKYVWIGEAGQITHVNPATLPTTSSTVPQPPIAYIVNASTISFDSPVKTSPVTLEDNRLILSRNYVN